MAWEPREKWVNLRRINHRQVVSGDLNCWSIYPFASCFWWSKWCYVSSLTLIACVHLLRLRCDVAQVLKKATGSFGLLIVSLGSMQFMKSLISLVFYLRECWSKRSYTWYSLLVARLITTYLRHNPELNVTLVKNTTVLELTSQSPISRPSLRFVGPTWASSGSQGLEKLCVPLGPTVGRVCRQTFSRASARC